VALRTRAPVTMTILLDQLVAEGTCSFWSSGDGETYCSEPTGGRGDLAQHVCADTEEKFILRWAHSVKYRLPRTVELDFAMPRVGQMVLNPILPETNIRVLYKKEELKGVTENNLSRRAKLEMQLTVHMVTRCTNLRRSY